MDSHSFTTNEVHELVLLYLQNQDLSAVSPEELVKMYKETFETMSFKLLNCKEPMTSEERIANSKALSAAFR